MMKRNFKHTVKSTWSRKDIVGSSCWARTPARLATSKNIVSFGPRFLANIVFEAIADVGIWQKYGLGLQEKLIRGDLTAAIFPG